MSKNTNNSNNSETPVVLITGSSSGIGAVTAIEFSRSGAQVIITGRNTQNLSEVAKECLKVSPKGLKALEVIADINNEDDCKRLIEMTVKSFGKLDILVNNEGFGAYTSIRDTNFLETFDTLMDTNLSLSPFRQALMIEN